MKKQIAELLRNRMKELNITVYSLTTGKSPVTTPPTLNHILSGKKNYTIGNLEKVLKALNINELKIKL